MLHHAICLDMGKNSRFGLVLTKIIKEINGCGELQGKDHCYNVYFTSSFLPHQLAGFYGKLPSASSAAADIFWVFSVHCSYLANCTE